ncbi:MAG: hypothetical protein QG608_772 [Actinomycetota bacterium]|nr:hypothetical protein [Actinomycetota bacterium]
MTSFELILQVDPIPEDLEDILCCDWDAVVGHHGDDVLVSVTAEGPTAQVAAKTTIARLRSLGICVRRFSEDLVSRTMIAERAEVTPQAVGNWIRGERQGTTFPQPFTHAAGGLWLWSEVNRWLQTHDLDDGMNHPDRIDYIEVNYWITHSAIWNRAPASIPVEQTVTPPTVATYGDWSGRTVRVSSSVPTTRSVKA